MERKKCYFVRFSWAHMQASVFLYAQKCPYYKPSLYLKSQFNEDPAVILSPFFNVHSSPPYLSFPTSLNYVFRFLVCLLISIQVLSSVMSGLVTSETVEYFFTIFFKRSVFFLFELLFEICTTWVLQVPSSSLLSLMSFTLILS